MDKARLKKRQSAFNGGGDKVGISKSINQDSEMGGGEFQGEDEEFRIPCLRNKAITSTSTNTKKFKLHSSKSILGRTAVVDHANVPRRLRSAMNKRTRESLSPPLLHVKKPHHASAGTEVLRMNGAKKAKQNSKLEGEAGQIASGPITKDEEEVAQTLFSLARMLPNEKPVENRVDRRTSDGKSSSLQDSKESVLLASQASKEESMLSPLTCSAGGFANLSSNLEGSSQQNFLPGLTIMGQHMGYGNNKFNLAFGGSTTLANLLRTSLPSGGASVDAIPLADPSELGVSPEFCHVTGSVQPSQHELSLCQQKLDYGLWPVLNAREKENPQQPILAHKGSGALLACMEGAPYLWPNMYRVQSGDGEVHDPSRRSPSTKVPAWLDSATPSTRTGSTETSVLTEKVQPVIVNRKQTWKRCAAHLYISHLIQAYQTAEKRPRWPVLPCQLKSNETTKLGVTSIDLRTAPNGVISLDSTNALNGVISTDSTNCSPLGKTPNELQICYLQEKRFQQDKQMSILSSGAHSSEKKTCDYLSLSRGGGGGGSEPVATSTSDTYQRGIGSASSAQGHVAYLHPIIPHHPLMPFSLPHVRSPSPQSQLPQYVGNPFYYPTHPGQVGSPKQQLEQQQHQAWAAQLASQYKPGETSVTHLPRWQNGIHDSHSLIPCVPPSLSSSPLELLGAKGDSQQQQLFAFSSSSIGKREHHPLPRSYIEGGGGLQADMSPRLQLVCSAEHM